MSENEAQDNSSNKKGTDWELTLKVIAALVAIAGFAFGLYQYYGQANKERNLLLQKQQFELYFKATEITSKFAQSSDPKETEQIRKQFWEVYYGQLSVVEDERVKDAMKRFGGAVKAWEKVNTPPADFFPPSEFVFYPNGNDSGTTFEQLSYELSQAVKASLES